MQAFEPLINLLVVLTVLSIVAERITNLLKLRHPDLKARQLTAAGERKREYEISLRSIAVGILVALAVKANFFELTAHLDAPWETFGWVQVDNYRWTRSPATADMGSALYALAGCVLTGVALGFGNKFWHDVLGSVYELRSMARTRNVQGLLTAQASAKTTGRGSAGSRESGGR